MKNFQSFLLPFSIPYASIISIRNMLFDKGILKVKQFNIPVISVGNITAGGTGKTPIVEYIAGKLLKMGEKVGIVSRGYNRTSKGYLQVRAEENAEPGLTGDEPLMLAGKLPDAVVAVDENRKRGISHIITDHGVSVVLLDDCFQHRWVCRDLDIVLVSAAQKGKSRYMLPAGIRREPYRSLNRADIIFISKYSDENEYIGLKRMLKKYTNSKIAGVLIMPSHYLDSNGTVYPLDHLKGKNVLIVSGIAQPEEFKKSVEMTGAIVAGEKAYPDHYKYTQNDIEKILRASDESGCEAVVVTEKDYVKFKPSINNFYRAEKIYRLQLALTFTNGGREILDTGIRNIQTNDNNKQ